MEKWRGGKRRKTRHLNQCCEKGSACRKLLFFCLSQCSGSNLSLWPLKSKCFVGKIQELQTRLVANLTPLVWHRLTMPGYIMTVVQSEFAQLTKCYWEMRIPQNCIRQRCKMAYWKIKFCDWITLDSERVLTFKTPHSMLIHSHLYSKHPQKIQNNELEGQIPQRTCPFALLWKSALVARGFKK